ncbi:hypothetical protein [Deinococcus marmoris]|uniref:Uncharacterized protein n=1 Tax=Deinococcus marmoris TaxID=249408 RepID=A0A1U7NZ94_9DEIO|nr:hypothetical protein [Deinococcus marmoris]OLV18230.1 hypothetical protein BOO71_0006394 [Deinococcus marmoris]
MTAPLAPLPPLTRLGRELNAVCAHATQPEEIAAALEANGLNDDIARERYGLDNVFACAEALFVNVPYREPRPATLPALLPAWNLITRGALYALPGAALAVAAPLLAPYPGAQTALIVSVVFGWGWGQGLASLGYRKSGRPLYRFLSGATLLTFPVAAALSALAALVTQQPVLAAALVGAVAGSAFAAFAALLILGRPWRVALVYLPSLACLLTVALGGVVNADVAWLSVAFAAALPLLVLAERTNLPEGLHLPVLRWTVPLAHATAGWSCGLFVTVVFGAALWSRLGAAALLPVIVSVGAMEVLSLIFHGRLRALAHRHGNLGSLGRSAVRALLQVLTLYLLVLTVLLTLYLAMTQPGGWQELPAGLVAALPLLVYGGALLLGTLISNTGYPWLTGVAWLFGSLVFLTVQTTQPQNAALLGAVATLSVTALGMKALLWNPLTYR